MDEHGKFLKENNVLSEWVVEGVWRSKRSLEMLQGWSTTHRRGASERNDHVQVLKLPPTLLKVFLHLLWALHEFYQHLYIVEKHIPIWNLLIQPNNIDKRHKRLHMQWYDDDGYQWLHPPPIIGVGGWSGTWHHDIGMYGMTVFDSVMPMWHMWCFDQSYVQWYISCWWCIVVHIM